MRKKKKEDLNYVYGGLEEFDDFQEIREKELYAVKDILNKYRKSIGNLAKSSITTFDNLKLISEFLKNDLTMLQNINSAIITLITQVEKLKKNVEAFFLALNSN
ncbi:MAG: hypothetical protein ACFFD2_15870 [Promethearchaeota archaeon]